MAQYQTNASVRRFLYLQQYQAHPQWEDYCAHVWKLVYLHKLVAPGIFSGVPLFKDWLASNTSMSHADFSTLTDMGAI